MVDDEPHFQVIPGRFDRELKLFPGIHLVYVYLDFGIVIGILFSVKVILLLIPALLTHPSQVCAYEELLFPSIVFFISSDLMCPGN